MDKRKEANLRVKTSIATSLLELMHQKSYASITITELIRAAGVARVSFYRNYESKEDVLLTLIDDVLGEYEKWMSREETGCYTYWNVKNSFTYFRNYRDIVLDLCHFGYGSILLEKLNRFHEEVAGTMSNHSIEKYGLYMYMGALFNTAIVWLENGAEESEEALAEMFCRKCGIAPVCGSETEENKEKNKEENKEEKEKKKMREEI